MPDWEKIFRERLKECLDKLDFVDFREKFNSLKRGGSFFV